MAVYKQVQVYILQLYLNKEDYVQYIEAKLFEIAQTIYKVLKKRVRIEIYGYDMKE